MPQMTSIKTGPLSLKLLFFNTTYDDLLPRNIILVLGVHCKAMCEYESADSDAATSFCASHVTGRLIYFAGKVSDEGILVSALF